MVEVKFCPMYNRGSNSHTITVPCQIAKKSKKNNMEQLCVFFTPGEVIIFEDVIHALMKCALYGKIGLKFRVKVEKVEQ